MEKNIDIAANGIDTNVDHVVKPPNVYPFNNLHTVMNLKVNSFITEERMRALVTENGFTHKLGDIWINTYPKSGTTWVQVIMLYMLYGETKFAHLFEAIPWPEVGDEIPVIYTDLKTIDSITDRRRAFKSHWPCRDHQVSNGKSKFIHVWRNGMDVAVSFYHHCVGLRFYNFDGDWDTFCELFLAGDVDFGSWWDFERDWWLRVHSPNFNGDVLMLTYEDMKEDIGREIRKIAKFVDVELTDEQVQMVIKKSSFVEMKEAEHASPTLDHEAIRKPDSDHFRKGIVGDYKNYWKPDQIKRFYKMCETKFADLDIPWKKYYEDDDKEK